MSDRKQAKKEIKLGNSTLTLETGKLAPQANRAVLASLGETVVLATAVSQPLEEEPNFFPLRVDYEEKLYAGGLIKNSRFIKREGRSSDEAIIAGRLIDHAIRPLFPKDYMDDTQVIVTVLQVDGENDPELLGMIAANAALAASDIPFNGPTGTVRVGMEENGEFVLNPSIRHHKELKMDFVISFVEGGKVLAMEGGFEMVPESKVLAAIEYAQPHTQEIINLINDFANEIGTEKYQYTSFKLNEDLVNDVKEFALDRVRGLTTSPLEKDEFSDRWAKLENETYKQFEGKYTKNSMSRALESLQQEAVRRLVIDEGRRQDGRKPDEIRPLSSEVGLFIRTHGSALFNRGLTQVLTITTLGSSSLEQLIQNMYGEETKRYIHHYNTPPFTYGDTGALRGPGRRDIGHGALAEKALEPVIPSQEEFPYTVRVVSEVLSSNGSTSMAATCGSTLSLMDAGVPIKAPVAGVGVGLIVDESKDWGDDGKYVLLTDMQGVEDAHGFMDFKMTGTKEGVTAIQMDIKTGGLPVKIFSDIFERSKAARLKVLEFMDGVINSPRTELSKYAPRIASFQIPRDMIGLVIGPGGKTIKSIIEETGATVDISDDGTVSIAAVKEESLKSAVERIKAMTKTVKEGEIVEGKVTRLMDYGAFVEVTPNKEGLLHVSEMKHGFVRDPRDIVSEGDTVKVKILRLEGDRIVLSKKALEEPSQE